MFFKSKIGTGSPDPISLHLLLSSFISDFCQWIVHPVASPVFLGRGASAVFQCLCLCVVSGR